MAITYYMLQISPLLLFMGLFLVCGLFGGLSTFLFRKYVKVKILKSHNEVTGFMFLALASFYALLLSFVVLVVWDQLNETKSNVSKEGSAAMGLYRDIKFYPDSALSKNIMAVYLPYVFNVIDEEFPNMQHMKPSRKTPESLNAVYFNLENLKPTTAYQTQLVTQMFNHLNDLNTYRGLRITSMETEISPPIWLPLIFGGIITIFCAMLLDIEHKRLHIALTALLGAFIGMFLFVIILLDHPYAGAGGLKPKSYLDIFTMDQWSKENYLQHLKTNLPTKHA